MSNNKEIRFSQLEKSIWFLEIIGKKKDKLLKKKLYLIFKKHK